MAIHFFRRGAVLAGFLGLSGLFLSGAAQAQDATMKQCGEKWQAAKAAGTTGGSTWPKFLAECRSGGAAKAEPAAAPVAKTEAGKTDAAKVDSAKPESAKTDSAKTAGKAPAPQPTGPIVFPAAISPQFSTLSAGRARRKTCSEQYQANKTKNANGGLKWLEKGGGYWSLCNAKLKT